MTTGILGGRFDPPHLGHLGLAQAAIRHFEIERLHVTVVADAAHKTSEAPAEHRLAMAKLTFAALDAVVELEEHRYTVDALEARGYDDSIFLIGADELAAFPTWKSPERVLELTRLGVASRPGHHVTGVSERMEMLEVEPHDISSTDIRARVRREEPLAGLVAPEVEAYIREHGLYVRPAPLH